MLVKCKHCGEKSDKSDMSKVVKGSVSYYVHEICEQNKQRDSYEKEFQKTKKKKEDNEMKEFGKKATNLFYEYTKSLEPTMLINLAFKKCREKGLNNKDIYDTMTYIIKHQCVLRFPMGILYYIDRAMKDRAEVEKLTKQNERVITAPIKIMPLSMRQDKKKDDTHDISDLL